MIETPGISAIWAALPEARIVGGAVRDNLAGVKVADVDFASPLEPAAVMERLARAGMKSVPTGLAHGTVTAVVDGRGFEITMLRRDVATDGRHAVVTATDDWREDAARRDFTINAMSLDRRGVIYDYFGGRKDLAAGRVRFVGDARTRIGEDYLRILRFFRFFARFGREPDAQAVAAIVALRDGLSRISVERVWTELKGLLAAANPGAAVRLMGATGVLALLVPGANVAGLDALSARDAPADPLLRLAAMLPDAGTRFADEKKLSGAERERLMTLRRPMPLTPEADDAALRRALADEPAEVLAARSWLGGDGPDWVEFRRRVGRAERPVFPLKGQDLLALGDVAGPAVGAKLAAAREWWMRGGCTADAAACLGFLQSDAAAASRARNDEGGWLDGYPDA